MIDWPDATSLIKVVRPLTAHGGRFLAETSDVLQYYLPGTTWRQWSNTVSITEPDGRIKNATGDLPAYQKAIARHYFSVVILSFNQTIGTDYAISLDLSATTGYRLVAMVRSNNAHPTVFYVWDYFPLTAANAGSLTG
jgi:hypothetical protein